jgi:hypothetical protein
MSENRKSLAGRIRASEKTREPVDTPLATDERVLARITDGIYRQPASALRELISNAYDADATEVIIQTDAPRFGQISVRDNGRGLSPEVLEHLVKHIGGSAKRTDAGKDLRVTSSGDENKSPGGRQLIGKLGIGLFSVAQFTRHFLIITKTRGDYYQTIADITLGPVAGETSVPEPNSTNSREIQTGHARIWRERTDDSESQVTEVRLLDLLPRTRAELASEDVWMRIEFETDEIEGVRSKPPKFHIGRMKRNQTEVLEVQPSLPWQESDPPKDRFLKLVAAVRNEVDHTAESVDLDAFFDRYLQTIWNLSLAAPLEYVDVHPFDLPATNGHTTYELENRARGQAKRLLIPAGLTPRETVKLVSPNSASGNPFSVFVDGMQLLRPILLRNLPKTTRAVDTPMLFIGQDSQTFDNKPVQLSGGPLSFEAYLLWAPRIVPKQHQGVMLRIGNASGTLFDRTFMGYQVSEQTRLRQITAEIFVRYGLDGAINIDRESFNYAHPHYQYIVKWLHSAIRQVSNKHKEVGKAARIQNVSTYGKLLRAEVDEKVRASLRSRGVEDVPEVVLLESMDSNAIAERRSAGAVVLRKDIVVPPSSAKNITASESERQRNAERKAVAVAQLLHGWNVLDNLTYEDQETLIGDIVRVMMVD